MKVFITGGTGFIGKRVVAKLVERGDEVRVLARSDRAAAIAELLGARAVPGDLFDLPALREGMQDCDLVFHIAAWYEFGTDNPEKMYRVNVEGTRNVMEAALQASVPKIVHTSSTVVFGDTQGRVVDEGFFQGPPFLTEYERTKWQAHYEVVLPLIEKGAPIIVVMPGGVYGPGDHSFISEMMHQFCLGTMPVVPGHDTALTFAHVDDVAQGHILAADKGALGESYILAGPNLTLGELFDLWALLLGRRRPWLYVPALFLRPLAPLVGLLNSWLPLPKLFSRETLALTGATYMARSSKAQQELGWRPRPLRDGMLETLLTLSQEIPASKEAACRRKKRALTALFAASVLMIAWLLTRRRD